MALLFADVGHHGAVGGGKNFTAQLPQPAKQVLQVTPPPRDFCNVEILRALEHR